MNAEKDGFFSISFSFFSLFLSGQESRQKKGLLILCTGMSEPGVQGGCTPPPRFFFRSVNPIYQPGTYYTPHITASPSPKIFRPSDISGTYVMRLGTSVMISLLM